MRVPRTKFLVGETKDSRVEMEAQYVRKDGNHNVYSVQIDGRKYEFTVGRLGELHSTRDNRSVGSFMPNDGKRLRVWMP